MFRVSGGIYTDTDWKIIIPGTEESYGPFKTYEQAEKEWRRRMFSPKLDIAGYRLFIRKI